MNLVLAIVLYGLVGLVSVIYLGTWLFTSEKLAWTFWQAFIPYAAMIYSLYLKEWRIFGVMVFMFIVLVHLFFYDKYFSHYKATRRGRR